MAIDGVVERTVASGIGYKRFIFDMAYQLRWGQGVDASDLISTRDDDARADVTQHLLLASVILHFLGILIHVRPEKHWLLANKPMCE